MREKGPVISYKVCFNSERLGEGIQGSFDTFAAALQGVESCRRWFAMPLPRGQEQGKVDIWIDQYKDGIYEMELTCEGKPAADAGSPRKGSSSKSRSGLSTEVEFPVGSK